VNVPRVLILGASGRLGSMLGRHWAEDQAFPIWQFRQAPALKAPSGAMCVCARLDSPPDCGAVDVVLGLAGIVPGKAALSLNSDLGLAAVDCAAALGARHVFLSSSAAVYGASATAHVEPGATHPVSAYGHAKLAMEKVAIARSIAQGISVTALRIGNVAGADALLGQRGATRYLDQFAQHGGAIRSYIGPAEFTRIIQALVGLGHRGARLPSRLNLALAGGVSMRDLCTAAKIPFIWKPASKTAVQSVVLDVTRLAGFVPLPLASAKNIVADWQADRQRQ
jgi:nucleoside-diphosphate-sugar epimerase